MKKPKWARKLTKKELQHVADASPTGRPSLRVVKRNATNPNCSECRHVAIKVGIKAEKI